MPLADTYLKLGINLTHPNIIAIPAAQRSSMVLHVGPGNIAFQPHQFDEVYQGTLDGIEGYASRWSADQVSLIIGAKNPYFMPVNQLGMMNASMVQELQQVVRKGLVIPTLFNKGMTVGTAATEWRTGFVLSADEIRNYFIEPRTVWVDITAAQAAPTANIEDFIYFPLYPGTSAIIEVIDDGAAGGTYDLQIWALNPSEGVVTLVAEYVDQAGNTTRKLLPEEHHQYIQPIISRVVAGGGSPELDVNVGMHINRITP